LDDRLSIDTPENILLDADIAGFGTRCIAAILDYLLLLVAMIVIGLLYLQSVPMGDRDETGTIAILVLIQFILIAFYHLFFEFIWNGQTPGKRWVGIRVVQSNGLPVTVSAVLIRNLVRLFDFLPFFYAIGLLVMFASKHTQRLGDLAARTIVIRERRSLTLNTVKEDLSVSYHYITPIDPIPAHVQIDSLTAEDRRAIIDFLRRRYNLTQRDQLARMLAERMHAKMDNGVMTFTFYAGKQSEILLEQIARAFEVRDKIG
jgi:uncharacterized RDD family membrane protein YckC